MRSLWPQLSSWLDAGEPFALATVTAVSGSAPRSPGSCMAIMPESARFIGSVSSGCLDVEVVEAAAKALRSGCTEHLRFGPDGHPPWTDGLTCGGWMAVRVEPWWGCSDRAETRAVGQRVRQWLEEDQSGVVLSDDRHHLALEADGAVNGDVGAFPPERVALAKRQLEAELEPIELTGGQGFVRTVLRSPRLLIVGGVDVTVHLVAIAREMRFTPLVVDPRAAFVAPERFPVRPARLERAWPEKMVSPAGLGPRDAALVLTHDPKIDDPALLALLQTNVGYIGALGSTRSHAARRERLRAAGADEGALARIHGPAGIHLGTPNAAGIALGIAAGLARWQAEQARARGGRGAWSEPGLRLRPS